MMISAPPVNTGGETYDEATLEAMTKTQLLALASELGVESVSSKSTKAAIVTAITSALS